VDAVLTAFDAIITNAAGCGSTLKEYGELLGDDPAYSIQAHRFAGLMKDVTEFSRLHRAEPRMGRIEAAVTYQDSATSPMARRCASRRATCWPPFPA
jgi:glycolate oxidase iron-sulfur subunit